MARLATLDLDYDTEASPRRRGTAASLVHKGFMGARGSAVYVMEGGGDDASRVAWAAREVTLVVYGWTAAEPGTLWWSFPSVATALAAARAMKNAVLWAIVDGPPKGAIVDIARARAAGHVLIEQAQDSVM